VRPIVLACVLQAGCLPVALPPIGSSAGGGISGTGNRTDSVAAIDVKVRPLAAMGSARKRPIDVGAGVAFEASGAFVRYGPALDVRTYPIAGALSEKVRGRIGAGVEGRVLLDDHGAVGPSGALYLTAELAGWTDGDCSTSSSRNGVLFGCYYGESGVGLRVQGSRGFIESQQIWTFTVGLEIRIPLLVGILFFIPSK